MKLNTIVTVYEDGSKNPMIQIFMVTTDGEVAKAGYEKLVAEHVAKGWEATGNYGNQVTLEKGSEYIVIKNIFQTEPMELTIGNRIW